MADKFAPNYALNAADNVFSAIWKLTRCMKAAGWTVLAHSNGVTKVAPGTNGNDSWGNNADPLTDTYPSFDSAAAWIVLRGPSTVKLALTGPASGTFLRGEQVVQAGSGATGEILGVVWDSSTGSGWAGIMPRTGTFDGVSAVTGQTSGASLVPNAIKTFVREIVFFKNTNTSAGTAYYICADQSAENGQLFSVLAQSAGATGTVAPGAGGTGNGFPNLGLCVRGTGGTVSHTQWIAAQTTNFTTFSMIGCVNATPGVGVSADGSFYMWIGRATPTNSMAGFMFSRLDDTEPGDIEPYIWFWNQGNSVGTWTRTTANSFASSNEEGWVNFTTNSFTSWKGYVARDCPVVSRDILSYYWGAYRASSNASYFPTQNVGQPNFQSIQNHPSATPPYVRDFMSVVTSFGAIRQHKGTVRWIVLLSAGTYRDTLDSKKWLCITPYLSNGNPSVWSGPLDGTTTPL